MSFHGLSPHVHAMPQQFIANLRLSCHCFAIAVLLYAMPARTMPIYPLHTRCHSSHFHAARSSGLIIALAQRTLLSYPCLCSLIGSTHFPRFPLLFIACAHSSVSAEASHSMQSAPMRTESPSRFAAAFPVGLRPFLSWQTAAAAAPRVPRLAYALPCGSLPVPCSMAQSKSVTVPDSASRFLTLPTPFA